MNYNLSKFLVKDSIKNSRISISDIFNMALLDMEDRLGTEFEYRDGVAEIDDGVINIRLHYFSKPAIDSLTITFKIQ